MQSIYKNCSLFLFFDFLNLSLIIAVGKNFVSWSGPRADFVVSEMDLVKEVMSGDKAYPKIDIEGLVKTLLGDGLVTTNGQKWANQRKLANHAFHADNLKVSFYFVIKLFLH